jgi:hypothetical protein
MARHDSWFADHMIDKPDQVVTIDVKIIQTFLMRRFSVAVYIDRIAAARACRFSPRRS